MAWDPWAALDEFDVDLGWSDLPIRGCYFPGLRIIALGMELTATEARSVLAHELGHHVLGHDVHPDQTEIDRMEERARRWAAVRLVSLDALAEALRSSSNSFEVAEELNVDPELLEVRIRWLTDDERETIGLVDE